MIFNKNKRKLLLLGVVAFAASLCITWITDVSHSSEGYKDKLIRLHVVANSDSPDDQDLKLKVRDEIISQIGDKLKTSDSINTSRDIVKENIDKIKYIALKEINTDGKEYQVDVSLDKHNFPTKSYGDFTLPAGEYEALKVVIGEGKGQNWWCVMFPPLCFVDITNGITDDKTKDELKKVLTDEEFNMIISVKADEEIPIKLKSKVVELFEKGKVQFAKIFVSQN